MKNRIAKAIFILGIIFAILIGGCNGAIKSPPAPTSYPNFLSRDYWPTKDWRISTPQEQGMDAVKLGEMEAYIEENLPQILSLLIVRHGYLVYEKYAPGHSADSYHYPRSVMKSFVAALVGAALESGYLDNLDQKVVEFFPEYDLTTADPRLGEVTLEHLLTMTTGWEYCPQDDCLPVGWESDPLPAFFGMSFTADPGETFQYNSPSSFLLEMILLERAIPNSLAFLETALCAPIGIWDSCQHFLQERTFRPRDMARFGYLYLNQGYWDGEQIIPAAWVQASTRQHNEGGPPHNAAYGYLTWVHQAAGHDAWFAGGYGGQFVYVVPDLDLVVVITSHDDQHYEENRDIIPEFIIPAIYSQ